eukprot:596058-Prorocentrum_minimum.AAC.2
MLYELQSELQALRDLTKSVSLSVSVAAEVGGGLVSAVEAGGGVAGGRVSVQVRLVLIGPCSGYMLPALA